LLSLIDSKFFRFDRGGISLGSILSKHEREILKKKVKSMGLRKILNLEKLMDVKLNETKNQVA
jgi:hypothetical protein